MEYGELAEVPVAGVPLSTPVAVLNVTPLGSAPFSLNAGAGKPEAVTVKVPGVPSPNVAMLALVMTGTWATVSVKLCVPRSEERRVGKECRAGWSRYH